MIWSSIKPWRGYLHLMVSFPFAHQLLLIANSCLETKKHFLFPRDTVGSPSTLLIFFNICLGLIKFLILKMSPSCILRHKFMRPTMRLIENQGNKSQEHMHPFRGKCVALMFLSALLRYFCHPLDQLVSTHSGF